MFRILWAATITAQLGGFIQIVATSWTMTALSSSIALVALVQTAANLPIMLFAIVSGTLADRLSRRSVMLTAQAIMLILSALLALFAAFDLLTPVSLLAFTFLLGCGTALHGPAWQASVGEIVPRDEIHSAVAANIVGNNLARSTGPAIGGAVVASFGAPLAFFLSTLSYSAILAALWRWEPSPRSAMIPIGFGRSVQEGLIHALGPGAVRPLLGRALLFSLGAASVWALMPAVVIDRGGDAMLLGLFFACFGVGAVLGVIFGVAIRHRFGGEPVVRFGTFAMALAAGLLGMSESVALALAAHLLAGAGWVCALSTFNVSIQLAVRRSMVGRQLAIYQTATFGSLALGSAAWGVVASRAGLASAFIAASIFLLLATVVGARLGLPRPITVQDS